jgi:hypothetical protein
VNAETFNALYEVGIPVFAYPGARPEDDREARRLITRTRSKAQKSSSGHDVVWVDGEGSYISLTHVDPVSEDEWEAAKTADAVASEQAPKSGSREWLEQLPHDERWPHTEVLAIYGDQVVNPSYDVALYHLRYAVAEVQRLKAELAEARTAALNEAADWFDQRADSEPDQAYRARVMRGAANDVRRLATEVAAS